MSYLSEKIPNILAHVNVVQKNQLVYNAKLLEIYEGSLQKFLEQSLRVEFSEKAFARAKERIAPINIIPKLITKISGVYSNGSHRQTSTDNEVDSKNLTYFEQDLALDSIMTEANKYLNLFRHCAIEPYIYKGWPELRVLPPTSFTVWTDDSINPLIPKVFVKFVGKGIEEVTRPRTNQMGVSQILTENVMEEVDLFHMYTDDEFLVVSSTGSIRYDLMGSNQEGINYFGQIPFVYLNVSKNLLIPLPNSDMFQMGVLIPKLLTDLNYATKFQSHAIMYTIDIESSNLDGNPDTMWDLKSREGEGRSPSVGTIKPEVDVDKVLSLIKETLTIWFDSLGIKASGIQNITAQSAQSGIAKAIDESDVNGVINEQKPIMRKAEIELWNLIRAQFDFWATNNELEELRPFSTDFEPTISYKTKHIVVDPKQLIETAKLKYEAGLTSFKRAVSEANVDLNEEQIKELIAEIESEKAERSERARRFIKSKENVEENGDDT